MKFLDNTGLSYLWGKIKSFVNNHTTVATCSTVASTSAKVVTINDSSWSLQKGCIIGVKFTNTNTATNVTLNVNNTGAKSIYYNASVYTASSGDVCGTANRTIYYMYDGTYWVWVSGGRDANDNNETAQTATTTNADYEVLFSGTADNTTRTEQARKNSNLKFNPSTGNLQATQLNGKTIGSDPKFTDTTYSDATTSESGLMSASDKTKLNGIAEGATANTGTITSVSTGAGLTGGTITTSGTIKANLVSETKLNNASVTSTESANRVYPVALDKNGKLAVNVPWTDNNTDTKVAQTATTTSANYEVLFSGTDDNTTRTEGARKNNNLLFNPSTGNLQATQLNGVNIGSSPKFTDTTYSNATTSTAGLMSASDKTKLNGIATGATANTGTVIKVSTGAGLKGGDITTSGTVKANLKSETQSTLTASSKGSTANREYAVGLDANGNLSVNVPWTDNNTTYNVVSTTENGLAPKVTNTSNFLKGDGTWATPTDTKNTAGATDSSSKLFIIGATSQGANPQTYSQDTAYVGTDGCLYSGGAKVLTSHQDISGKYDKITQLGIKQCNANGQYNYFKIATLKITQGYVNGPIAFELSQREYEVTTIQVSFLSDSGFDPGLGYFITNQRNNYWIVKETTSTWSVYGTYNEVWGACALHRIVGFRVNNGVTVTVNMENVSKIPSGATQVTYGGNCAFATSAGNASKVNNLTVQTAVPANAKFTDTTYSAGSNITLTGTVFSLTKANVTGALGYTPPTSDTNTHRPIQVNGTEILGNNTTALNLKAGSNVSLSNSSGTVTIAATDTTYSSKSAASGGTDVSLVTTGEKYTWNNKASSDTKNTAGSTDTSSKIFLIGATSQATNPQTYSHDTAYVGTDGCLYSGGKKVLTDHQNISGKANLASPAFTGTPTAPTATAGTNTTQIATTAFVQTAVSNAMVWNYGL